MAEQKESFIKRLVQKAIKFYEYCTTGVWSDTRSSLKVNIIKTLSITIRSFLNTDIQTQACAMTYRTLLAIVPALALLFAIGRGFGLQNFLQDELYNMFPSQKDAIRHALAFVDSYLNQASEGIFVGIGLLFLLYTVINLMSNVEDAFNLIWNVRQGRSFWRKITDYTAMLLILPVLMICGGGLAVFVSNTLQTIFHFGFMTPVIKALCEIGYFLFTCLFFAAAFMMIPNTKVKFKNAMMAGLFTGVGFSVLQWLFVSGQLYVAKYNAIYGTFSFLPLMLIWLQFVWVIFMSGALICYASQNIFQFTFSNQIQSIAPCYKDKVTVAIATVIVQHFVKRMSPVTDLEIIAAYGIPSRLVTSVIDNLTDAGVVSRVIIDEKRQIIGYQPAVEPSLITIDYLRTKLNSIGYRDFIPKFGDNFPGVVQAMEQIDKALSSSPADTLLSSLKITTLSK